MNRAQLNVGHTAARARAAALRLVVTDCDGVLTDGGVYVSEAGESLKRFSLRDGMGVERLRLSQLETVVLTREVSPIVALRCEKLKIRLVQGARDKADALPRLCAELGVTPGQVGYIGDDVNDLGAMALVAEQGGLTASPADGEPEVTSRVHLVTSRKGGHGAFRDFAESILVLRGDGAVVHANSAHATSGTAARQP